MANNEQSVVFRGNSGFKFSGADINSLGSSEYTLVGIAVDSSVSIEDFTKELEQAVKTVVESCQDSPRSDNLMIRVVRFDRTVKEVHGFTELNKCDVTKYDDMLNRATLGGATALYDGCVNVIEAVAGYAKELSDNDYSVNGVVVVLTDGLDNNSSNTISSVQKALKDAVGEQKLESLVSILVGVNVNNSQVTTYLNTLHKQAGMSQYVDAGNANAKTFAKLANFISKSISSQSQVLGTGGVSQNLTF